MTAPAVVRRWNDPSVRVGRAAHDSAAGAEVGRTGTERGVGAGPGRSAVALDSSRAADRAADRAAAVRAGLADQVVRLRRVAPGAAVLLTGLVVHAGVVPHLTVRGAAPDVLLVAVVAVAVTRGSRAGAAFGFAAGLGADVFLATPLGTSALAYTLLGHVLGGSSGRRPARSASALCRPGSPCFSCRTGRHRAATSSTAPAFRDAGAPSPARRSAGAPAPAFVALGSPGVGARLSRARRRSAARRAALRRSVVLTGLGVAAGHLIAAVVATSLGGAPFPGSSGVVRMAAVAVLSAPLGPPAAAALQRVTGRQGDGL